MIIHRVLIYFKIEIDNEKGINTLVKEENYSNIYLILKCLIVKQSKKAD